MSIIIEKCSEYNVRIMKTPDFKNKTHGYNFSYPLMNSIEICNLFISGGTIEVSMIGSPKSIYSFDEEKKTLTIQQKNKEQKYIIDNPSEIGETMIAYFESNKDEILTKTLETNLKKSQSKIGNQNAVKPKQEIDICDNIKETVTTDVDDTGNNTNDMLKEYPIDFLNHKDLAKEVLNNNPKEFCQLKEYIEKYNKSAGEYFYWVAGKGRLWKTNSETRKALEDVGYPVSKQKDIEENYWRNECHM